MDGPLHRINAIQLCYKIDVDNWTWKQGNKLFLLFSFVLSILCEKII